MRSITGKSKSEKRRESTVFDGGREKDSLKKPKIEVNKPFYG